MTSELQFIKYGVGIGLAVFVIKELFNLVYFLLKVKKGSTEDVMKETSRDMIRDTNNAVTTLVNMQDDFYATAAVCQEVHGIVTAKSEGVPLIYNKGLERSINILSHTMENLAMSIKELAEKR